MNNINQRNRHELKITQLTRPEIRWRVRAHIGQKRQSKCHIVIYWIPLTWYSESEAQVFVLHSNKITFIPDKVTVLYRNDGLIYFMHMHGFYPFNHGATGLIFHDISERRTQVLCMFLKVWPKVKWSAQICQTWALDVLWFVKSCLQKLIFSVSPL